MKIATRSQALALAALAVAVACSPSPPEDARGSLQGHLEAIANTGATRVHVMVNRHGDEVFSRFVHPEDGGPVLSHYEIGVSAQAFVATVVLQLTAEGELSLDDVVEDHLPRAATGGGTLTIRDLLRTGGPGELDGVRQRYTLVGMVIESITGQPWEEVVDQRIIEPLGLDRTTLIDPPGIPSDAGGAGGSVISTPEEIRRFFTAVLAGELFPPEQLAEMQGTVADPSGVDSGYGLGIEWRPLSCGAGYWGNRSTVPAYRSYVGFSEDGERSVVLSNATTYVDQAAEGAQHEASLALVDRALCARD